MLTDGRPPQWHQMLVPALPTRASDGGELRSCVFGGERGQAVPPNRHRHLLHDLPFAFSHLDTEMRSVVSLLGKEKHCGFLNQILLSLSLCLP